MPINDIFPNTPGFVAQIQDGGLVIPSPPQTLSQTVLLLGVATDGPVNTPIQITSMAMAETLFGQTSAANSVSAAPIVAKSLTRGMYEAYQAGCTDIRLVRVGGVSSTLSLTDSATASNNLVLSSGYPGVKYNALSASVVVPASGNGNVGTLTITTIDGVAHPFTYTAATLYGDLISAINLSGINVNANQGISGNQLATVSLAALSTTLFTGGNDGTNVTDAQYSAALAAAYPYLENYAVNVVVPLGAYLQPTYALDTNSNPTILNANGGDVANFGQNLAQFCARLSVNTSSAYGVISIAPLQVPTFVNAVNRGRQLALTAYSWKYASGYSAGSGAPAASVPGTQGTTVDLGYLINIVAGPDPIVNNQVIGNYVMDGAATYAGLSVSLAPQNSTTNQPVPNILALSYNYGASVIDNLSLNRFVTFMTSQGSVRVVADQTYGLVNSDFTKLSTLRITYAAMEQVRSATSGFIGQAANPANLNALGTAVNSALTGMKKQGALLDYSYQIAATAAQQIAGNLQITLVLVPALEIRKIYVTISLTPPAAISSSGSSGAN